MFQLPNLKKFNIILDTILFYCKNYCKYKKGLGNAHPAHCSAAAIYGYALNFCRQRWPLQCQLEHTFSCRFVLPSSAVVHNFYQPQY
jgi:hypothetical protein